MLLIGSGVVSAFYIIDSSERNKSDLSATTEAQFLLRKVDWELNGAGTLSVSGGGATLNIDSSVRIDSLDNRARISRDNGSTWEYLTAERIPIENLLFDYTPESGTRPASVQITFTADDKEFEMIKYLRE